MRPLSMARLKCPRLYEFRVPTAKTSLTMEENVRVEICLSPFRERVTPDDRSEFSDFHVFGIPNTTMSCHCGVGM